MLKAYIETTVFNRFLEEDREYNPETKKVFEKILQIDGIHIAMAAINNMDCIVSLNFRHINRLKTKMATEIIHRMKEYNNPFICSPMEVI